MLTLYFSGTGNTEYIAKSFSRLMDAKCLSIEADVNFTQVLKENDTVAFCYPIYGSRLPRNMREFVAKHMSDINGKKIVILVTQSLFSGDGARALTDLFWDGAIEVIYAEHFCMPNNVNNVSFLRRASERKIRKYVEKADAMMLRISQDLKAGIIKKRGFSRFSQAIGSIQGKAWQGDSREVEPSERSMEFRAKKGATIHKECTACNLCVEICPVKNLANKQGKIVSKDNCVVCYRCINRCPEKAISIWFSKKPKWQYKGVENVVS